MHPIIERPPVSNVTTLIKVTRFVLFTVIFVLFNCYANCQITSNKIFKVQLKKIDTAVIEISNGTISKLESIGFKFDPNYAYLSRNYTEQFDFNKDGYKDLVLVFGKDPSIGSPITILLWDNTKKKFIESPEYMILGHGDHMFYYDTVDDFDGDGDIDVYFPMENYHGIEGKQPSYYLPGDKYMPGNFLRNSGKGFERIYIDTTSNDYGERRVYPNYSAASLIYYDQDEKKDLIVPSINQHPLNKGYLATKYSFNSAGEISREFVFPWNNSEMYKGQTHSMAFKNYNNKIYAFLQTKEDYPDGINNLYYYTYPEVWIYEKSKNSQDPIILKKIELKRNISLLNAGQILNHDTFYITDLDKDGNEEIIIGMFSLPLSSKHFSVNIFDNTGKEITDKWLMNEEFIDHTGAAANGFDVLDLNNDGLDDILFRDHFNSTGNEFSILMNTGKIFEQHVIKTNSFEGFNMAVDRDKNGIFEILRFGNKIKEIDNSVVGFEIDINNCSKISKPTFNTSTYSFCNGDSLRLSITNVNKGDTLKWYFGTRTDFSNTATKVFTDSTKLFVTRTDSLGCMSTSDTIQISKLSIPPSPILTRDAENNLTANTNNITWYKDGVKISDTSQKIKPAVNGYYTATTTQNGCKSALSTSYYYLTTSVSNLSNDEYFRISPNPTNGEIFLNYNIGSTKDVYINLIDANGRIIINNRKVTNGSKLNIGSLGTENYYLQAKDKTGRLLVIEKLIKN
jgi:hypothetical protein